MRDGHIRFAPATPAKPEWRGGVTESKDKTQGEQDGRWQPDCGRDKEDKRHCQQRGEAGDSVPNLPHPQRIQLAIYQHPRAAVERTEFRVPLVGGNVVQFIRKHRRQLDEKERRESEQVETGPSTNVGQLIADNGA